MLKRQGRVLVQLKNLNGEEQQLNQIRHFTDPFSSPPGSFRKLDKSILNRQPATFSIKKIIKKIKKHDQNTVLVDIKQDFCKSCPLKNYCKFDVVGNEYDRSIHIELENIAEEMIVYKNDCVLLNIEAQRRDCPVRELGEILVTNVTSQLLCTGAELQKIVFEYCDLRKYDVVNMLGKRGKGFIDKGDIDNSIEFPTLLMFLKWLHKSYPKLWKVGQNHDFIDVQMVVLDKDRNSYTHRLSIFYFYLSKMDIWTRIEFSNFLKNMRVEKPQMKQTMIADCLREYFNSNTNWSSWFFFKIPNSLHSHSNIIYDMLQMAVSVFDKSNEPILAAFKKSTGLGFKAKSTKQFRKPPKEIAKEGTAISATINSKKEPEIEKKNKNTTDSSTTKDGNQFCRTDFERLSYWYNQMDEKFADVIVAMKEYYQSQYQQNMFNMNKEIENIACTVYQKTDKKLTENYNNELKLYKMTVQKLHAKYLKALKLFKSLNERFVCSTRYNVLNLYYNKKCTQLEQLERNFIKKRLKCCKKQLSLIISSHLDLPANQLPVKQNLQVSNGNQTESNEVA